MITGIAGMVNEMFSRSMIDWWLPENFYKDTTRAEAGGLLGAAYKYAVFMNLGVQAFRYAAEPFFFSNANNKNSPELFAKVNHYFVVTGCVVLLGVSLNMNIFKFLVGEPFWNGLAVVPILLLAYLFLGIYYNMSVWFKLTDKTYFGTLITMIGVLVTVAGNYFLIPLAGFTGSSMAALLCYFTMTVSCYLIGQRYYSIPYWILKDSGYILLTYAVVLFVNQVEIETFGLEIAFHQLVFLAMVSLFYFIERKNLLTTAN
jgi:O-antigen/teichoic acid export membrane protein